jgi:hypothetical protein
VTEGTQQVTTAIRAFCRRIRSVLGCRVVRTGLRHSLTHHMISDKSVNLRARSPGTNELALRPESGRGTAFGPQRHNASRFNCTPVQAHTRYFESLPQERRGHFNTSLRDNCNRSLYGTCRVLAYAGHLPIGEHNARGSHTAASLAPRIMPAAGHSISDLPPGTVSSTIETGREPYR